MQNRKTNVLSAVIILIGYGAIGTTAGAIESASPERDQAMPVTNVLDLDCNETVSFIPVDPTIAKGLIPADKTLYVDENGAQVLFIAQDCSSALWNGNQRAPLRMAHIWIRLDGPEVVSPVSGADMTRPTFYWWDYAGMTTHEQFSRDATKTGKHMDLIDSIEFTLASHGQLVERDSKNDEEDVGCTWTTSPAPPLPAFLGVNHLIYGCVGNKSVRITDSGVIRPASYLGQSKFLPMPGSALAVFGPELYGETLDFSMRFKVVLETTSTDAED